MGDRRAYDAARYQRLKHERPRKPDPIDSLSDTDVAYLAGLIDGEGSVYVMKHRDKTFYPAISIIMTHEGVIAWVASRFGLQYSRSSARQENWADQWAVRLHGVRVQNLCRRMLPYLKVKRRQAELLLEFPGRSTNRPGGSFFRTACKGNARPSASKSCFSTNGDRKMGDKTGIEWTDATWSPITGCSVISTGCDNCYAMGQASGRLKNHPAYAGLTNQHRKWNGKVRLNEHVLDQPLRWRKPRRIFVCSMSDLFHENIPDEWIDRVFAVMTLAPQHTFQVLTKRSDRMNAYIGNDVARFADMTIGRFERVRGVMLDRYPALTRSPDHPHGKSGMPWPLPNVWCGVSVENESYVRRMRELARTPAVVRYVSFEPLLDEIETQPFLSYPCTAPFCPCTSEHECAESGFNWAIVGGESGPNARPMHPRWVRGIRDECAAAGVSFFFKQWGEWAPWEGGGSPDLDIPAHTFPDGTTVYRVGKKAAGRLLDGVEWNGIPNWQRVKLHPGAGRDPVD